MLPIFTCVESESLIKVNRKSCSDPAWETHCWAVTRLPELPLYFDANVRYGGTVGVLIRIRSIPVAIDLAQLGEHISIKCLSLRILLILHVGLSLLLFPHSSNDTCRYGIRAAFIDCVGASIALPMLTLYVPLKSNYRRSYKLLPSYHLRGLTVFHSRQSCYQFILEGILMAWGCS